MSITILQPTSQVIHEIAVPGSPSYSIATPASHVVHEVTATGPQGPPGSPEIVAGVAVDLKSTGPQTIYTAQAGAMVVVTGVVIRPTFVSGFVSGATIYIQRSDGRKYVNATPAATLNATDEALFFSFSGGVIPTLSAGQSIQVVCSTGADAATLTASVAIFGLVEVV